MKIAVMGAGAVGCYFGGLLAQAGHDVTLIGRSNHVEAIRANGLLLETREFSAFIPMKAATDPSSLDPPDLVLFCVKSADTEAAGRLIAPSLEPGSLILSLQNGVDNAARLSAAIGRSVIPAAVYVGTEMAGPGHVRHHGRGELLIGASTSSDMIATTLTEAGIPTTVSSEIDQALWTKLIINCAYNALSAVAGIPYGPLIEVVGARDVIVSVIEECRAVAHACGVSIPDDMAEKTLALPASMPNQQSSTAQDLARGRSSEIDFLNGYVVRKGAELGIPAPTNQALQVMVKLVERSRAIA
jgi:2-dehydropantoate 2-reductase